MWLTDGQTDGQTDGRHTIIRPKFHFGHIVYTHGLTDLCTYALRIMGSYYFLATFTILQVHHR